MATISFRGENYGLQIGDNRGTINAEFLLPPGKSEEPKKDKTLTDQLPFLTLERPKTPPGPTSTVPFRRDPDFVCREKLLGQIYKKNSVPGSRIALVGLGGVGKSQLAIEYSFRVRSKSPSTWVFWVHASNETRFEQSFRDIADMVKIPGRQDPTANIFSLIEQWLWSENLGRWVMILDNVDDFESLGKLLDGGQGSLRNRQPNAPTKPLLEYIPRSQNGTIIITSRTKEVALKLVDIGDMIEVGPMDKPEALELFQRKLRTTNEIIESRQLVEELNFMPLAIVQAASYIRNRAPRCSVSQYLTNFQSSDREATKLLHKEASDLGRDWEARNSIVTTWQISFEHIRQTKPSAANLLSLMSFFDRQGIPVNLIRNHPEASYTSNLEFSDDSSDEETSGFGRGFDFEDDVLMLRDYSFISLNMTTATFFTMHRLVQLTTRAWLKSHEQIDQWKEKFINILYREFPTGQYENWGICRSLFPHVRSAISQKPKTHESLLKWATLLYRGAWYASESGNIADVRDMASRSSKQRVKLLGADNAETLASTGLLAKAYFLEGLFEEAEQLDMQVMKTRKTKLGEDHLDTLKSMASLALTYRNQGRWKEAEQLAVQVMKTRKTKLGEDHLDTLKSMASLALTYRSQGRWKEAEQLEVPVMETRKAKLGKDHPDTLQSMNNLASTLWSQGRWKKAEQLDMEVMALYQTKLGVDHPDTLSSIASLASTFWSQGRWKEAEQLFIQVTEARKTKLGEDHPHTLTSMANLASTYRSQGRWKEAEQLEVQVIETRKTKLGVDHPETLASMANLAVTYMNQGRWEMAEPLNMQVMETRKAKLGVDHPDTLKTMANLASTNRNQGRWKEAEELEVLVMETRKTKLGVNHPDTLASMANLAFTLKSSGHQSRALDLLRDCLARQKQVLGLNHPQTLSLSTTLLEWETLRLNTVT